MTVESVQKESSALPPGFSWREMDLMNDEECEQVQTLLRDNQVEDDDAQFRFDYSKDFIRWACLPPNYYKDIIVGCSQNKGKPNERLVGFITGIPCEIILRGKQVKMIEVNFLCVHKDLRSKRLAAILIKECRRRANVRGIFQAVYTAGVLVPSPVAKCRQYHRNINSKKLLEVGFTGKPPKMALRTFKKLHFIPTEIPDFKGTFREMKSKDIPVVTSVLNAHLTKFGLYQQFSENEVKHWILPRKNVVQTYVIEDKSKKIEDFTSFYNLSSSVLKSDKHTHLQAAQNYYTVANTVSLKDMITAALVMAQKEKFDVQNCLDVMDNKDFFEPLRFGKGDGELNYQIFNQALNMMNHSEIAMILL